jgi:hypothetical protein
VKSDFQYLVVGWKIVKMNANKLKNIQSFKHHTDKKEINIKLKYETGS